MRRKCSILNKLAPLVWAAVPLLVFVGNANGAGTLPGLINGVLDTHPALRAQRSLAQAADAGVKSAGWQFFPTPSVSVEQVNASAQDSSYRYGDSHVGTVRLQQPLWTGGRLTAGLDKAKAGVDSSQASLDSVRQDLALRVVQIYADWAGAHLSSVAAEKSLQVHVRLREQIVRRIEQGVSASSDLTLLAGREDQTNADLSAANARQVSALARLSQLLGRPVVTEDLLVSVTPPLPISAKPLELLVKEAQDQNPAVRKQISQSRVYEAEISEKKADLSPEIYLRLERQYGSFTSAGSSPQNRIFIGLSTRFGAGLSASSEVSGAEARYQSALADTEASRVSVGEQVVSDYVSAKSGQQRLDLLNASLTSSEAISNAWSRQFLAGRKTWLDVMNAARELAQLEAQIAEVQAGQLMLTWRLSLLVLGVESTLGGVQAASLEVVK